MLWEICDCEREDALCGHSEEAACLLCPNHCIQWDSHTCGQRSERFVTIITRSLALYERYLWEVSFAELWPAFMTRRMGTVVMGTIRDTSGISILLSVMQVQPLLMREVHWAMWSFRYITYFFLGSMLILFRSTKESSRQWNIDLYISSIQPASWYM